MNYLRNAWYCAALSEEVGEAPFARRILDEPVLIARDTEGAARAMSDMCPHRFAPLHKGIREGDSIECPYHGLRFDLGGRCVHNPHGSGRIPAAANLHAYPIVERQGVIWLWPGDPAAADESLIVDLRLIPRDGAPIAGHLDMAVDYRLVIDNLLDLSHAPYIHPGTLAPARMARQSHFDAGDRSLQCRYLMRDVETPAVRHCFSRTRAATFIPKWSGSRPRPCAIAWGWPKPTHPLMRALWACWRISLPRPPQRRPIISG